MSKILRLRKQKRFLNEREGEMLRRGLRFLEELDVVKEKERQEKERQSHEATTTEQQASPVPFDYLSAFEVDPS